ncbi:hypothetical protein [Opitutus terrae]|uniref:L-2-amino-thiazoline-4-carboxylic acid hydrolase n=1 Tax=Opitutus terrae (strain DSM 11246 / JCM 15787 / PB90-1) TaxID=452637 RepID=B1ZMY9_OPITP|nr:hypothetical protein [Opitutus terrae]ACB76441.1 hypothetical protein Oter_3161 [Opitutus terrae PB90-1]
MKRKEFLQQACTYGLCSCAVASLFAPAAKLFAEEAKPEGMPEKPKEDWRIGFMQERYAKLLASLEKRADSAALDAALEDVGQYCASTTDMVKAHAGDPDGFLATIREKWHADATQDKATGVVALAFPAMKECPCALVRAGLTSARVCQCSVGWQKKAFGVVFGRPVEVALKGSLLRGDPRCSFEIRVASKAAA